MAVVSCGSPSGPAFWVSQLLASGVPWLVVHAVLFPLTVNQGLLVHGVRGPPACLSACLPAVCPAWPDRLPAAYAPLGLPSCLPAWPLA